MAINFPDTPSQGDVHVVGTRSWTWDGTAWTSNTSRDYINTISETEPTNPVAGDTWFKSSTGQTFIYYDGYWIETGVAGPRGPAGDPASLTRSIRTESADTTLTADDANQMLRFTGTDLQVLTIPDVLSVGESVQIVQDNSGQIEFSSGSGVTLLSDSGEFGSNGQNTRVDLVCVGAGEYRLYGELVAVSIAIEYAIVAGGGGAGSVHGGGGGAGEIKTTFLSSSITVGFSTNYAVTVGAGGAGGSGGENNFNRGTNGANSSAFEQTSLGGGGGGVGYRPPDNNLRNGLSGGSGGGGGTMDDGASSPQASNGGSATAATYGSAGAGAPVNNGSAEFGAAGGGGGASQAGQSGTTSSPRGGKGGDGLDLSSYVGTSYGDSGWFSGGGTGGGTSDIAGDIHAGGNGGGGSGAGKVGEGTAGMANTGGGGGAGGWGWGAGYNGGSGIVILRYPSNKTISIGAGLTGTTSTVGDNKVTEITAGTGNISFS